MHFEWDDTKRQINLQRHGIDFADLPTLFDGPMLVRLDERREYGEDRWIGIGLLGSVPAVVVYVERSTDTIRIISARKANRYEQQHFQNQRS